MPGLGRKWRVLREKYALFPVSRCFLARAQGAASRLP